MTHVITDLLLACNAHAPKGNERPGLPMRTTLRHLLLSSDPIQQARLKVWATSVVGFVLFSIV